MTCCSVLGELDELLPPPPVLHPANANGRTMNAATTVLRRLAIFILHPFSRWGSDCHLTGIKSRAGGVRCQEAVVRRDVQEPRGALENCARVACRLVSPMLGVDEMMGQAVSQQKAATTAIATQYGRADKLRSTSLPARESTPRRGR